MPEPRRNRTPPHHGADAPQISASEAKNSFGRVLDRVAREGPLAITRHDQPFAVLVPIAEYRALVGAQEISLNSLAAEFDALFERMQEPGAAAAMQKAFALTPDQLGRAAVKAAARSSVNSPLRTAVKTPVNSPVRIPTRPPARTPVRLAGRNAAKPDTATSPAPLSRARRARG